MPKKRIPILALAAIALLAVTCIQMGCGSFGMLFAPSGLKELIKPPNLSGTPNANEEEVYLAGERSTILCKASNAYLTGQPQADVRALLTVYRVTLGVALTSIETQKAGGAQRGAISSASVGNVANQLAKLILQYQQFMTAVSTQTAPLDLFKAAHTAHQGLSADELTHLQNDLSVPCEMLKFPIVDHPAPGGGA